MGYKCFWIFVYVMVAQWSFGQSWTRKNDIGADRIGTFVLHATVGATFSVSGKIFVLAGLNGVYQFDTQTKSWISKNNMPDSLVSPVAFVINNLAYIGSGISSNEKGVSASFWRYDEKVDSWTRIASLPVARTEAVGFSLNNIGYVGLGSDSTRKYQHKEFFAYDPATDKWMQVADFPGTERRRASAFTLNDKGYVGTGVNGSPSAVFKDFWCYEPAVDKWSRIDDLPGQARYGMLSFQLGGKPYVGTGTGLNFFDQYSDFYTYRDSDHSWQPVQSFPLGLSSGIAISNGVEAFVGKGVSGQSENPTLFAYDETKDVWTATKEFHGVNRAASFKIKDQLYVLGGQGYQSGFNNENWAYRPADNKWMRRADFPDPSPLYGHSTFVIGNTGYLIGGTTNGYNVNTATWKYDADKDVWTSVAQMPVPRNNASNFVVGNKGYVACGVDNLGKPLRDLWEYDPNLDKWTEKMSLPAANRNFAQAVGFKQYGYLIGGQDAYNKPINEVWSYDPSQDLWNKKKGLNGEGILGASATATSQSAYLIMGRGTKTYGDVRAYDVGSDTWKTVATYPGEASYFGVAESINDKLYLGLGVNSTSAQSAAFYELDPPMVVSGVSDGLKPTNNRFSAESPFAEAAKLFFTEGESGFFEVNIFGASGILLSNTVLEVQAGKGSQRLSATEQLPAGHYFLFIHGENFCQELQIIKAR